jgi:hypothetical protein
MVGVVFIIFWFWFGLGVVFDKSFYVRLMTALMPTIFFVGFGLFTSILPLTFFSQLLLGIFFGGICYLMFLVENVFLVAIGYKTVPLYRAAYTVNLIILLISVFFLFDSLYSFKLNYWLNTLFVFLIGVAVFTYQFFCIAIELPDDGKNKNQLAYTLIPAWLLAQMALIFSFWPVGVFKGSIYLVLEIYVLSGLIQADIRDRLFKRTYMTYVFIGGAAILGILLMTSWR